MFRHSYTSTMFLDTTCVISVCIKSDLGGNVSNDIEFEIQETFKKINTYEVTNIVS